MNNTGKGKIVTGIKIKNIAYSKPVINSHRSSLCYIDKEMKLQPIISNVRGNSSSNILKTCNINSSHSNNPFPNLNELKISKVPNGETNSGSGSSTQTKVNLRKDLLKLYEKNYKKYKNENPLVNTVTKSPVQMNSKLALNTNLNTNISNLKLSCYGIAPSTPGCKKNKSNCNSSNTTASKISSQMINSNTSNNTSNANNKSQSQAPTSNIVYNELAKQLKINKNYISKTNWNFSSNNSENNLEFNNNLKQMKSFNNSESVNTFHIDNLLQNSNRISSNIERNITERIFTQNLIVTNKTTKDTNSSTLKLLSCSLNKANDIEGPEELHYFYVNIFNNNKKLAYKFERTCLPIDGLDLEEDI